jgi:tripartite motif-containing protein 71
MLQGSGLQIQGQVVKMVYDSQMWRGRTLTIALEIMVLVLLLIGEVGAEDSYEFVLKIPSTQQWYFDHPVGIAVDSGGNVYVADFGVRIQKFSSSGGILAEWGNCGYRRVTSIGMAVDSEGNVYVANTCNQIQKFSSSGGFLVEWGSSGSDDGQFSYPEGVAVDSEGNVYVVDRNNDRIQKFNSSGGFLAKWGSEGSGNGQFNYPGGIAVDSEGNVYVADSGNNRIQKFNSSGGFLAKWGSYGSDDGQFIWPYGIAVDSGGNVYVAESGNDRIQKFSSSGSFLDTWGSHGKDNGQFNYPSGIAVDSDGNVYVADNQNNRIQKFSSSGGFLAAWGSFGSDDGQFNYPKGVAMDSEGNVHVADSGNNRIQKFSSSGSFSAKWGSEGSDDGQFNYPSGIAVDSEGSSYVADTNNNRTQKFSSSGSFLAKWGSEGSDDGQFNVPVGVAVDRDSNVYIADSGNNRIQKFSSSGGFLAKWGSFGSDDGQFDYPSGVAVDSDGNVYVADRNNHRIQKFSLSGSFLAKRGSFGSDDGQFNFPSGVAVDRDGNVYVTDSFFLGHHRIQKFNSSGSFLTKWGSEGSDDGQFNFPEGVSVDSDGNVYVADSGNSRIQKFRIIQDSSHAPPVLTSIDVSPPSISLTVGDIQSFTAEPKDQYGNPFAATVTWKSDNTTVGTVDPGTGEFNALAAGTTMVNATNGSITGSAYLTVIEQTQPPVQVNLIDNPGFESGTSPWVFYTIETGLFNVKAPVFDGNSAARVTLNNGGTNVQLYQKDLTLEPNTRYRLSFAAYSTTGHDLSIVLLKHASPYTRYGLDYKADLGTIWQTFTTEFTTSGFKGTVDDGRLMFWLAPFAAAGDTYYIDAIHLEKVSEPGINLLNNPGFESGTASWLFYTSASGMFSAVFPVFEGDHEAELALASSGSNIQLYQTGIILEPNTRYRLSFAAYCTTGHDLSVVLLKHVSPFTSYGLDYEADLDTSWKTFTTEFTTTGFTGTANDGRLMFYLAPFAAAEDTYYIDDVRIEKV